MAGATATSNAVKVAVADALAQATVRAFWASILVLGLMAMGPETVAEVPPILPAVSMPKTAAPFSAAEM